MRKIFIFLCIFIFGELKSEDKVLTIEVNGQYSEEYVLLFRNKEKIEILDLSQNSINKEYDIFLLFFYKNKFIDIHLDDNFLKFKYVIISIKTSDISKNRKRFHLTNKDICCYSMAVAQENSCYWIVSPYIKVRK